MLAFPADTNIVWKSHDDSIAQRSAIDQARHEKSQTSGSNPTERRRTGHDDSDKGKGTAAL
jgi:translation initiation factor 4E